MLCPEKGIEKQSILRSKKKNRVGRKEKKIKKKTEKKRKETKEKGELVQWSNSLPLQILPSSKT